MQRLTETPSRWMDKRLTVPSPPLDASCVPSGEKQTELVVVPFTCAPSQVCGQRSFRTDFAGIPQLEGVMLTMEGRVKFPLEGQT